MADGVAADNGVWADIAATPLAEENFWTGTIAPVVAAAAPRRIMEIGTESGGHTDMLLAYCQSAGAHLDLADIRADIRADARLGALLARHPRSHDFHPFATLDAIPILPCCDLAILDTDPNWFTVYHALQLLFARAVAAGQHAPIVILHGTGWPNARRDTYRDPGRIPERHAYAQRGIVPGQALLGDAGVNATRFNAVSEGGPLNGVLTAAEDFVASWAEPIEMHALPFMGGLGIMVPSSRADAAVLAELDTIFSGPSLLRLCARVDEVRVRLAADLAARNLVLARKTLALGRARSMVARLSSAVGPLR